MHQKVLFTYKLWPTPLPTNIVTPSRLCTSLPAPIDIYAHCLFNMLFLSIISTAYHLLSGCRATRLLLNWLIDWLIESSADDKIRICLASICPDRVIRYAWVITISAESLVLHCTSSLQMKWYQNTEGKKNWISRWKQYVLSSHFCTPFMDV